MTETLIEPEIIYARRTFAVELEAGDGRTVDVRIVPYGERIRANDGLGGLPAGMVYEEEMLPGVFDHQINAAHRVLVNVEHEQGITGVVGRGLALRSAGDGFYGSFRMLDTPAGDTALELTREKALGGVSYEARFVKSIRTAEGVVQRVKANLRNIALCRDPAYSGAVVLGLREADDEISTFTQELAPEFLPLPFDAELAARIERLGIDVPSRLKNGHLAADTSPAGDTSVDDTSSS